MTTAEFADRLQERTRSVGVSLTSADIALLEAYFQLLSHWNRTINLTSLPLTPLTDESLDRLLVEPLAAAIYMKNIPLDWVDVGSGGGSPAFPIKIAHPEARLTLIETRSRKAAFLREVARELRLRNVEVVNARFEDCARVSGASVDLITVRAVKIDRQFESVARGLLKEGGELFLFSSATTSGPTVLDGFRPGRFMELLSWGDHRLVILERANVPRGTLG